MAATPGGCVRGQDGGSPGAARRRRTGAGADQPPAAGSLAGRMLWWATLLASSSAVLVAADRLLRRLIPLAAVLQMSVLFPGRAPTRFGGGPPSRRNRQAPRPDCPGAGGRPGSARDWQRSGSSRPRGLAGPSRPAHPWPFRAGPDLHGPAGRRAAAVPARSRSLRWAALLHDIGKLTVPGSVLGKPGLPSDVDWLAIKAHRRGRPVGCPVD